MMNVLVQGGEGNFPALQGCLQILKTKGVSYAV